MPLTPLIIKIVSPFVTEFGSLLVQTRLQALLTHKLGEALGGTPFSLIASWHLNARWSIHWSSSCQKIQKVCQNTVQSSERRGDKYKASWYFFIIDLSTMGGDALKQFLLYSCPVAVRNVHICRLHQLPSDPISCLHTAQGYFFSLFYFPWGLFPSFLPNSKLHSSSLSQRDVLTRTLTSRLLRYFCSCLESGCLQRLA